MPLSDKQKADRKAKRQAKARALKMAKQAITHLHDETWVDRTLPTEMQGITLNTAPVKVYIWPEFKKEDEGDGGVRRVVEAQRRHLPTYGVEVVTDPDYADVLACHIAGPEVLLKRYPDKPLIAHNHGLYWSEMEWPNWCLQANEDCLELIRQADVVTGPSEWVSQALRRHTMRDVIALGHGVDYEEWQSDVEPGGYVLWNKTRVDPVCDPEPVMRLAALAPDVMFMTTFGAEAANIMRSGRLSFEEGKVFIQRASVYLATARETFGIGTLEAMAAGVPVLGWDWGGQAEMPIHEQAGYLARPFDYEDLLIGLRYCLDNHDTLSAKARQIVVERYQWKDVIKDYAEIYKRAARPHAGPRVSVIVPAYNLAEFLPQTLDSVLAQTEQDWECIIVDDASPDTTGRIADEYAARDNRFRVVHNAENQYLAGSLNTGASVSRGRYLLPLDADNLITPQTLRVLADELARDRSIQIAYGNVEFWGRNDYKDGEKWHSGWPMAFKAEWQLQQGNNMIPSTSMYHREVWERTGGYRRRWKTAEDADFWTRATSFGFKARMVTETDTLIYRNRAESMSRTTDKPAWHMWYPWCITDVPPPAGADLDSQPLPFSLTPVKVSVIIPVGPGHEQLVMDAIDSVIAQTFLLWEIIVVDDTKEGLNINLPSFVRVLRSKGKGPAAARNLGILHATGKFFVPLDADDTLEPTAMAQMYQVWEQFKGYVYSDWNERWTDQPMKVWETQEYNSELLLTKGCLHAVTALYEVEHWQRVGGFDESLPAWEDWDFQLKLARDGICGTRIPEALFTYRKDTGMRREENMAEFDRSKMGIRAKWSAYFERSKTFMGCGCGGGKVSSEAVMMAPVRQQMALPQEVEGYVLLEYTGGRLAGTNYKAPSGAVYRFSVKDNIKLVAKQDVDFFLRWREFSVRSKDAPQPVGV